MVTFINYRHLYSNSDLCGSWKKIFWEQGILRCVLRALHRSVVWTVWTLCFPPGCLWDLVCIAWSPVCLNKQSHFAEDKSPSAPVVICNPSGTILLFFGYCICLKKKKNLITQKGLNETKLMRRTMSYWCVCVRMWMCVYKHILNQAP